jgi:hypothetical protein
LNFLAERFRHTLDKLAAQIQTSGFGCGYSKVYCKTSGLNVAAQRFCGNLRKQPFAVAFCGFRDT